MTEPIPTGNLDSNGKSPPLREKHLPAIAKSVAQFVREYAVTPAVLGHMLAETEQRMEAKIAEATKPLLERIAELEKRKTMS